MGDPTGIGPELVAKLLADPATARAGDVELVEAPGDPRRFPPGALSAEAGAYALRSLALAVDLAKEGRVDAICFAPLNKQALHLGGNPYEDELHWLADRLGVRSYVCEINVANGVWSSRVTSHVPLKDVSGLLSIERIVDAITLIDRTMRDAGIERPRVAVCGLNPHLGDGGLAGHEEIDVIRPAVERASALVSRVEGPVAADRVFLKVRDGAYDGVVTMYHDQGQIALKLLSSGGAVSLQGGLPIPVTTPAHGTAFDIVGRNVADPTAMRNAFELACRMGARRRRPVAGS